MPLLPGETRPVASIPFGTSGTLSLGRLARANGLRLATLGLRSGTEVTVLSRTAGGGRLVGVGTSRIGIDRDTSRRLELFVAGSPA